MKFVIMADGKMLRWKNRDCPKHMVRVDREPLLRRTVRLLRALQPDCRVIITSHNPAYETEGAERYEPLCNELEIDRFTWELIESGTCFLYGDVYYTEHTLRRILAFAPPRVGFAGSSSEIVAVVVRDGAFMRENVAYLRERCLRGEIGECKGWQLYRHMAAHGEDCFLQLEKDDGTEGFNTEEEYRRFLSRREHTPPSAGGTEERYGSV